jgi:hypothetical protein
MANRKTFNDFNLKFNPHHHDFLIGYDVPEVGGEKRYPLSHVKNYFNMVDVTEIVDSMQMPLNDAGGQISKEVNGETIYPPPFLNGRIFHVKAQHNVTVTLPPMNENDKVHFVLVNMSEEGHKVDIESKVGKFNARGSILRHKFDNAYIYFDGNQWNGYGDLGDPMNIKDITTREYIFERADEGKVLHFFPTETTKIILPPAENFDRGTQFYAYNFSLQEITIETQDGSELFARHHRLLRKYDDAVIYTDGRRWFATGDLS